MCIRDFIDLKDLSQLHLLSRKYIKKNKSSILFSCGTSKPFSVLNIIKKFEDATKNMLPKDYKKKDWVILKKFIQIIESKE